MKLYKHATHYKWVKTLDKNSDKHLLVSNEAVAPVFKRLADRLQGVVSDTYTVTITPEYDAHFLIQQALTGDRNFSISCQLGVQYPTLKAMLSREDHI
jgi:hypothetical protein